MTRHRDTKSHLPNSLVWSDVARVIPTITIASSGQRNQTTSICLKKHNTAFALVVRTGIRIPKGVFTIYLSV
jgi:hypothetical protein